MAETNTTAEQYKIGINAINELQSDIRDIKAYMDTIDAHIHWLGSSLPNHQVEIPELKAMAKKLSQMDGKIAQVLSSVYMIKEG